MARHDLLRTVAAATAGVVGDAYLSALVRALAEAFGDGASWVAECAESGTDARVLACWPPDAMPLGEGFAPSRTSDGDLVLAAPDAAGRPIGLLALRTPDPPLRPSERARDALQLFATRVGAELERRRQDSRLRERETEILVSRARVLQAGDEERRRIGRDIHDGVQQRLVALTQRIDLARRAVEDATPQAGLLDDAREQVTGAMWELRELATGLHPAGLADRGLAGALRLMGARSPVPLRIIALPERRLPDPIELTVYFIVSEALSNAAKYARATEVTVEAQLQARALLVTVADDGVGGAALEGGSGLRGLGDRVTALGGRLTVDSPGGGGTTLAADIPLAPFRDAREPFIEFGYEGDGGQGERMIGQVMDGTKRAAISLAREWDLEGGTPRIGTLLPVQDHHGRRHATVRVTQTTVVPFVAVDAAMATAALGEPMTAERWRGNRLAFYEGCRDEIAVLLGEPDWRLTEDEPFAVVWFELVDG